MKIRTSHFIALSFATLIAATFSLQASAAGNPPKPKCPMGQITVMEQGSWQCQDLTISSNQPTARAAQTAPKPHCPRNQIAKLESGIWVCRDLTITAPKKEQRAAYMKLGDIKGE
jgi:ribosomal protein L37AE/L43A